MGAIVLKYVQLMCVAFFVKNSNCAAIADNDVLKHLRISACVAECLSLQLPRSIEDCYKSCDNSSDERTLHFEEPAEGTSFRLYCRDAQSIIIEIEQDAQASNETFVYLLKVRETTGRFTDRLYLFSDEKLINVTVDDVSASSTTTLSYNIATFIVSSRDNVVQQLPPQTFTTLMRDYRPGDVTEIAAKEWSEYYDGKSERSRLNFTFTWQPDVSHTCHYEVFYYGDDVDLSVVPVTIGGLFEHTIADLGYDTDYYVAVRAVNAYNDSLHGREQWRRFDSLEGGNNLDVTATVTHRYDSLFDVLVEWHKPKDQPATYLVVVTALQAKYGSGVFTKTVDGNETRFLFKKIEIMDSIFMVDVTAYASGGNVLITDNATIQRPAVHKSYTLRVVFYVLVALVAILLLFLFKVWRGRIDSFISRLAQKRVDDLDIEIVKTMSTGTVLDAIAELTKDECMEVTREHITVQQLIGEGAFGLVKKGLVVRNGEKQYVAVKMIKNTSNIEDIKQFHQEISVMKSVGRHPNIVSIVGHCTSDINELMLLTEYCDDGSLLDLLRLEFARQLKFYDAKTKQSGSTAEKYADSLLNFDVSEGEKKEISYKNIDCTHVTTTTTVVLSSKLFVVNQLYEELSNNLRNEALMTATNELYLKLRDTSELKSADSASLVDDFLTSGDLLSYAHQICDGMDFLARKKVVHRDLAARNILVCSRKTVKISDFGLSRDIYQDLFYRKTGNGKLPIKWLALESMTHQVYTSQSDVWSFGVLLYEIVTLGAVPYSSINVENLLKFLRTGFRLERPSHCHALLYELMMLCWHANPMERPTFEELSQKLQNLHVMEKSCGERVVDLAKMFSKCVSDVNYMNPSV